MTDYPALLLTKDEAAQALRVSVRTVERLVALGELEPRPVLGAVRFAPAELEAFANGTHARIRRIPAGRVGARQGRAR